MYRSLLRRNGGRSNLFLVLVEPLDDSGISRVTESALHSALLIVIIARTVSLGPVVESITKRFMNAGENVTTRHEYLGMVNWHVKLLGLPDFSLAQRRSNRHEDESRRRSASDPYWRLLALYFDNLSPKVWADAM